MMLIIALSLIGLVLTYIVIKKYDMFGDNKKVNKHGARTTEMDDQELADWIAEIHAKEPGLHNLYSGDTLKLPIPPFHRDQRNI